MAVEESVLRVRRRTTAVLLGTQVLGGVGVAIGVAVSGLVAAELSGSDVVAGAALTSMVVGAALAAFLLARVATRSGRRPALLCGYALAAAGALGAVGAVAVRSWPLLLVALVPFGAATACGLAARFAATDLAEPGQRGRALALVVWAVTVGAVAGPNLSPPTQRVSVALGLPPPTGPFLLCVVVFLLAAVAIWAGLRPDPLLLARNRAPATDDAVSRPEASPWRVLRTTPLAQLAVTGVAVSHGVMVGLMSLTPLHMDHAGASLRLVGLVISLHVAAMYALSPLFGWLADRVGRLPVLALGAGLLVLAGVVGASADGSDTARLSVGLIALGLGWSAALVGGSTLLTDSVPVDDRAGVQGLSDVAMNVSGALGGVLAGVTVAVSSYPVLALAVAVCAVPLLARVLLVAARPGTGAPRPIR